MYKSLFNFQKAPKERAHNVSSRVSSRLLCEAKNSILNFHVPRKQQLQPFKPFFPEIANFLARENVSIFNGSHSGLINNRYGQREREGKTLPNPLNTRTKNVHRQPAGRGKKNKTRKKIRHSHTREEKENEKHKQKHGVWREMLESKKYEYQKMADRKRKKTVVHELKFINREGLF